MSDKFFFIPNETDISEISKIKYDNVYNVKDTTNKQLIFAPLNYNDKHFFLETDYLKILDVNKNNILVKMNERTTNICDKIDDNSIEHIKNICEHYNDILSDNIEYISINNDDTLKLNVNNETTIKINGNKSNLSEITKLFNSSDNNLEIYMRSVIRIGSINIYPNADLCHNRIHLSLIDIKKVNLGIFNSKILINDYSFSTKENDLYQNLVLDEQDFNFIPTINNNYNNENSCLNKLDNIKNNNTNDNNEEYDDKSDNISDDSHDNISDNVSDDISDNISDDLHDNISDDSDGNISDDISDDTCDDKSDNEYDNISSNMSVFSEKNFEELKKNTKKTQKIQTPPVNKKETTKIETKTIVVENTKPKRKYNKKNK